MAKKEKHPVVISFRATEEEADTLAAWAKMWKCTVAELVRRHLDSAGYFKRGV